MIAVTRKWNVGRYLVEGTMGGGDTRTPCLAVEWAPTAPESLTPAELREYRRGRAKLLASFLEANGLKGQALVVEV